MTKRQKKRLFELVCSAFLIFAFLVYDTYIENKENTTQFRQSEEVKPANVINESNLKIYFIDVGQADCILIDNNQEYALIDAGNNNDGEKLVNYFTNLGIKSFRYVIGTHAHEDHIGGMDDIIKNFTIEHFFMPDIITTTKTFEDVLDALKEKHLTYETPPINATFTLAEAKFTVLFIGTNKTTDLNDSSIVLKMQYGDTSYLFMGDATSAIEKEILEKDIKSDVLKVGHHGSQYSSTAQFLKKVNPKYAIIEVGKENNYGHPRKVTLNKLERLGTKVYRTDKDGTIILKSNGKDISFETLQTDTNG